LPFDIVSRLILTDWSNSIEHEFGI